MAELRLKVEQASLFAGNRVAQGSWIYEWSRHCRCHCSPRARFGSPQGRWRVTPGRLDVVSKAGRLLHGARVRETGLDERALAGNSMSEVSMRIDIDKLTEAELIDLNNRVVARLQFLAQTRAHAQMLEFKIGDRVSFQPDGHRRVVGMLTRYNRKTVTVITDDGQRWNVSPRLLGRADEAHRSGNPAANIIPLRKT